MEKGFSLSGPPFCFFVTHSIGSGVFPIIYQKVNIAKARNETLQFLQKYSRVKELPAFAHQAPTT